MVHADEQLAHLDYDYYLYAGQVMLGLRFSRPGAFRRGTGPIFFFFFLSLNAVYWRFEAFRYKAFFSLGRAQERTWSHRCTTKVLHRAFVGRRPSPLAGAFDRDLLG